MLEKTLSIKIQTLPECHQEVLSSYRALGDTYYKKGDFDKAFYDYDKAYNISKQIEGPYSEKTIKLLLKCASLK